MRGQGGRRSHTPMRLLALALAAATAGACSVLPTSPEPLPDNWVPEITASAGGGDITSDGFSPAQRVAVRIRVETCTGWGTGSGWVINDSQVITNRHVIEGATHIEVTTYDGKEYVGLSSQVAPVADLGIVTLDPVFTEFATPVDEPMVVGSAITVVGYPSGQELTVAPGTFVDWTKDGVGNTLESVLLLEVHAEPGSSGSAVYNEDGEVIGILYAGNEENTAEAWPTKWLFELLDGETAWQPNGGSC